LPGRYYRRLSSRESAWSTEELFELELDRTAFLIIDVTDGDSERIARQKRSPKMYRRWVGTTEDLVVDHIVPARAAAKQLGLPIVYLTNYLSPA